MNNTCEHSNFWVWLAILYLSCNYNAKFEKLEKQIQHNPPTQISDAGIDESKD